MRHPINGLIVVLAGLAVVAGPCRSISGRRQGSLERSSRPVRRQTGSI